MALILNVQPFKPVYINHLPVMARADKLNEVITLKWEIDGKPKQARIVGLGNSVDVEGVTVTLDSFYRNKPKLAFDAPETTVILSGRIYDQVMGTTGWLLISRNVYNKLYKRLALQRSDTESLVLAAKKSKGDGFKYKNMVFTVVDSIVQDVEFNNGK